MKKLVLLLALMAASLFTASYAQAQEAVEAAYRDRERWAAMAIRNVACSGKFSSDRTIEEYVKDIWHLEKMV